MVCLFCRYPLLYTNSVSVAADSPPGINIAQQHLPFLDTMTGACWAFPILAAEARARPF